MACVTSTAEVDAENLLLVIKQGARFAFEVSVFNENGTPFDLTGFTGRAELRRLQDRSSALLGTFVVTIQAPATAGKVLVDMGATVTRVIAFPGFFDVEVEEAADSENVIRIAQGQTFLDQEVTGP